MAAQHIRVGGGGDVRLHVEIDGSGPPPVLLSGAFCNTHQWDVVLPALTEHFTVIRHDVRGTGQSDPGPAADYRFEQYTDDIVSICDQLLGDPPPERRPALWGMACPEASLPEGWSDHVDRDTTAQAIAAALHHPDLMPFVTQVENPVLIATGDCDPTLTSSRRALGGFSDARLEVLDHTGHGSVLQRPDHTTAVVLAFLQEYR